ncbi:TPA: AAA family ATPase [Klebsiella pneumoniae]|nr:AAA family ATPase [Klebsiella pneumoniae]HBW5813221.1 AAA family ATPase [Klebsiella pneumoniae]
MILSKIILDGVGIDLINDGYVKNGNSYFTLLVGVNGRGKSRILEAISATGVVRQYIDFKGAGNDGGSKGLRMDRRPIGFLAGVSFKESCIHYELKGSNYLSIKKYLPDDQGLNHERFSYDYSGNEMPSKIICVTNSVFNKFPSISNAAIRELDYDYSAYQNLSISEDFLNGGKELLYGTKAKVFSKLILNAFFSGEDMFNKVNFFLNTFGISGRYRIYLRAHSDLKGVSSEGVHDVVQLREWHKGLTKPYKQGSNELTDDIVNIIDDVFKRLFSRFLVGPLLSYDNSRYFPSESVFDIYVNNEVDSRNEFYEKIKIIADFDIIQVEKIEFMKDGDVIGLDSMSSGELNLFILLFKINSVIENDSLILIDEPELSLHPSWQNEVIPSLQKAFSSFSDCHFIIATHSPHVVASIPENDSCVTILNNYPKAFPGHRFSGRSPDFQLFSVLGFVGAENDYLITQLIIIISKLAEESPLTQGEQYLLDEAGNILQNENTSLRVKHLILQAQRLIGVVNDE